MNFIHRWWERRVRPKACSECFQWFDREMLLNERRVTPDNPECPIRRERCCRYSGLGRVIS